MSTMVSYPSPPVFEGLPGVGPLVAFRRNAIQTVMDGWHQCGDIYRFAGPLPMHVISHPHGLKRILEDNAGNYEHPGIFSKKLSVVMGRGLITSEGRSWFWQRKLIMPAFHKEAMATYGTSMTDSIAAMADRWEQAAKQGEVLDIRKEMTSLTLTILAKCLFRADFSRDAEVIGDSVQVQMKYVGFKMRSPVDIPESWPLRRNKRFLSERKKMDGIIYRLIEERRQAREKSDDMLTLFMEVRDAETGEGMTDQQIRDEVMTLFIAGHDTTASALTWIFYLLSKNPEARGKLQMELAQSLGGRPATPDDVRNLRYNRMVIQEALRLYPPLWALPRMGIAEDVVMGYRIPAKTFLLLPSYVTHRNPEYWENPEGFDPERFLPERSAGRPQWAYFPFSGGPRGCLGFPFTMLEMQLALATFAQRFQLDLVPGHPFAFQTDITLNPKFGQPMIISTIKSSDMPARNPDAPLATVG